MKAPPEDERPFYRSDRPDARIRLLAAALDLFSRLGFDRTRTRDIARHAQVNLAAIPYYFGGKEGLYLAVAQHIADEIGSWIGEGFAAAQEAADDPRSSPAAMRHMLIDLVEGFAGAMLGAPQASSWARFVIREQLDPSAAFPILFDGFMSRGHRAICGLVGRLLGLPEDDEETLLRAFGILGQVLVFRAAHAAVLRRLGWDGYTPERIAAVKGMLRSHVIAIVDAGVAS